MIEKWKRIPGFDDRYEVSSLGRIRSVDFVDKNGRRFKGRYLNCSISSRTGGYRTVWFEVNGHKKANLVHRIVASCFCLNPNFADQVNHINGDKADCRAENLEWVTAKENTRHAIATGLFVPPAGEKAEKCRSAKLTNAQVTEIKAMLSAGISQSDIAKKYGVVKGTIGHIKKGATWASIE